MHFLLPLVLTALALLPVISPGPPSAVLVRKVIDGVTLEASGVGRVRLLGVAAAPGQEARDRLASLVVLRWVRLEYDAAAPATSARHAAYVVRDDGVLVNAEVVREGLARVTGKPSLARFEELRRAEREAQQLHRGIWAQGVPRLHAR